MALIVLLNKPYDVLSQFTDGQDRSTLADYINDDKLRKVYPAGRLDRDSEGLVVLTDNGQLQHEIANPKKKQEKEYWVQVEGEIDQQALSRLCQGVELKDGISLPAQAETLASSELEALIWPRVPPIRERKTIATSWLKLTIREGRNRQVRRMCAAVGYPCLRLIRVRVGQWRLANKLLQPGHYEVIEVADPAPRTKYKRSPNKHTHKHRGAQRQNKRSAPK
ncbi:pseudouridine synthase [Agaribacterium sp. ZY112]|uniref:pseudouridine synthase n=1 Tax=Agaribacterium sp. ZY112 TaxID=3233574 RepID=UPI0035265B4E